jgi:Asp-tRNA(Asn)/Glu-tRNA(Gln) amidotransferase B subunit
VKTFPILNSCVRRCHEQHFSTPLVVSFDLVKRHEKQAMANHSQTVERLAERGGLSWFELLMVLTDSGSSSEYFKRIRDRNLTEAETFRIVSNVLMHEFSTAYAGRDHYSRP